MNGSGVGFFKSLFTYKERVDRSPFEDFVTEIVCELFNEASKEGCIAYLLERLLYPNDPDYKLTGCAEITWRTQYYIGEGLSEARGKRPDLVGSGKLGKQSVFFLFEHKINAEQSYYELGDGVRLSQLQVYAEYVKNERREDLKEMAFVTRSWPLAHDMPRIRPISWRGFSVVLREFVELHETCPRTRYLAEKFCEFLEVSQMASIELSPVDVVSYEPWKKLRSAIEAVGKTWPILENHPLRKRLQDAGFGVTHGAKYGEWRSGENHVTIFTPLGTDKMPMTANDSFAFFYAGVVLDGYGDWVKPMHRGLPSFAVGFTLMLTKDQWKTSREQLRTLVDGLNGQAHDVAWHLTHIDADCEGNENELGEWQVINLVSEKSFFDALHVWGPEWSDQPHQFFSGEFRRLAEVLQTEDIQLLVKLAKAAEDEYADAA